MEPLDSTNAERLIESSATGVWEAPVRRTSDGDARPLSSRAAVAQFRSTHPFEPSSSIAFGRFALVPHRRELLAEGKPLKLGGRAYDVLMALVETPGAVISKDALMMRAWPNQVVEESALQVQISAVRAAFQGERALIRTVSGRGYQFTGAVRRKTQQQADPPDPGATLAQPEMGSRLTNLRESLSELIGRERELFEIQAIATRHRLVTLTGAGGIGKTRLAVAVAHELLPHFVDGVCFADLAPLTDPDLVPAAVAAAMGLEAALSIRGVAKALRGKQLLCCRSEFWEACHGRARLCP